MRILGLESSGARGGVALLEDDRLLGERIFEKGMVHGRDLAPAVDELLRERGLAPTDVHVVAVDIGPGSYTGLRVGIAAAKGLCLAAGCAAAGIASVDALILPVEAEPCVVAAIDARWDQIYGAVYERGARIGAIVAEKPDDFLKRIPRGALVVGDAVEKYGSRMAGARLAPPDLWYPKPSAVAALARRTGRRDDPAKLVPLYLRPTEAEIKFGQAKGIE